MVFAEHCNFTCAAEQLNISQPALHVQIRKLEQLLGARLYRKVGRRLELTVHGREVLAHARDLVTRSALLVDRFRGSEPRRPVVLAAGAGTFLYLLGPAIRRFVVADPAPLRLLTRTSGGTVEALLGGAAQLGVTPLEVVPDELEAEKLAEIGMMLVMRHDHPLADRQDLRLADLEGASLVVPPAERPHRIAVARSLREAGVHWQVAVEANGWELMLHFVRLGLGLAVVNSFCCLGHELVGKPLEELPRLPFMLLRRRDLPLYDGVAALQTEIRNT